MLMRPQQYRALVASTLSDSFTDGAGTNLSAHTPEVGSVWTYSGTHVDAIIDSSGTEVYFPTVPCSAFNAIAPATPDYYVEGVIDVKNKSTAQKCVVIARMLGASAGGIGFGLVFSSGAGLDGWILYDIGNNAFNQLDQGNTTLALGLNTVRITMSGTSVVCELNGSVVSTTTQTLYPLTGFPGIAQSGNGTTDTTGFHITSLVCNPGVPAVPPTPFDLWDPDLDTFTDTGFTNAVLNNDPIRQVNSQRPTGHNLLNTGGSVRPLLKTSAINGHSSMLFDGSNDYIQDAAMPLTTDITLIMAIKQVAWTNGNLIFCDTTNSQPNLLQNSTTPHVTLFTTVVGSGAPDVAGATVGSWVILSARWTRTAAKSLRVNLGTRSTFSGTCGALAGVLFGAFVGLSSFSNIEVGRIALYNSFLSDPDEDLAVQSFGTYYGLF